MFTIRTRILTLILLIINGNEWTRDPRAPSADDGMGGRNSVVLVGPE